MAFYSSIWSPNVHKNLNNGHQNKMQVIQEYQAPNPSVSIDHLR